jgi:hypothetical protein
MIGFVFASLYLYDNWNDIRPPVESLITCPLWTLPIPIESSFSPHTPFDRAVLSWSLEFNDWWKVDSPCDTPPIVVWWRVIGIGFCMVVTLVTIVSCRRTDNF